VPSNEAKLGIGAAVVTATGAVIAAVIGLHHSDDGRPPAPTTTSTSYAHIGTGVIHAPSGFAAVFVYAIPTDDLTMDRIGKISDGLQIEILCTAQGPDIKGPLGYSTVWDKINYNGGAGYVPDGYVDTPNNAPAAPAC